MNAETAIVEKPTREEIDAIIARTEVIREKWHGNPGYARTLDVELYALRFLAATRLKAALNHQDATPAPERSGTSSGKPGCSLSPAQIIERAADIANACDSGRGNEKLIVASILDLKEEFGCS